MISYKITRFPRCDILIGRNDVERLGFDKNISEDEIIELAVKHGSNVIVKNGNNGKWYLKGNGIPIEVLQQKIEKNIGKYREGVYCILLEDVLLPVPKSFNSHAHYSPSLRPCPKPDNTFEYNGQKYDIECLCELRPLSLLHSQTKPPS